MALIITRSRSAALGLVEESRIILVKLIKGEDVVILLKKKLGIESNSAKLVELLAALEFMPLAIV